MKWRCDKTLRCVCVRVCACASVCAFRRRVHKIMQVLLKYLRLNARVCVIVGGCIVQEAAREWDKDSELDMGCKCILWKTKAKRRKEWRHLQSACVFFVALLCGQHFSHSTRKITNTTAFNWAAIHADLSCFCCLVCLDLVKTCWIILRKTIHKEKTQQEF